MLIKSTSQQQFHFRLTTTYICTEGGTRTRTRKALVPKTSVSTIPPPRHFLSYMSKNTLYRLPESNRYEHCCPRDFKSLVSTYFTKAAFFLISKYTLKIPLTQTYCKTFFKRSIWELRFVFEC
jgi:hypothetical protein